MASHAAKCARLTAHAHTAGLGASWRFSLGRRPKRPEKGAVKPPAAPCPSPPRTTTRLSLPNRTDRHSQMPGAAGVPGMQEPQLEPRQAPQGLTCLNHLAQDLLPSLVCQRATRNSVGCLHVHFYFFSIHKRKGKEEVEVSHAEHTDGP